MKFSYKGVENCCVELENCLKRIQEIHDDCDNQMKKIQNGSVWQGPASESFVTKCQKTIETCRTMERSLGNIIIYIRHCAANYKKVDEDIMSVLSKFNF